MKRVTVIKNNISTHLVNRLRDITTGSGEFRNIISELSKLLFTEASMDILLENKKIKTWIGEKDFLFLPENKFIFVPILRAGLPMLEGLLKIFPEVSAGFLGIKRNEETLESQLLYERLPNINGKIVFLLDPMIATGNSLSTAVNIIKEKNPESIYSLNIVGAPEGISYVTENHPDLNLYITQIDEKLNKKGYILPGLGDAGDRAFHT